MTLCLLMPLPRPSLQVDLIVCYDGSATPVRDTQRMGRTGRHKPGRVVYLLAPGEALAYQRNKEATARVGPSHRITRFPAGATCSHHQPWYPSGGAFLVLRTVHPPAACMGNAWCHADRAGSAQLDAQHKQWCGAAGVSTCTLRLTSSMMQATTHASYYAGQQAAAAALLRRMYAAGARYSEAA